MSRWIVVVLLIGCGGSKTSSPPTHPPSQPALVDPVAQPAKAVDCKTAVEHVVTTMAGTDVTKLNEAFTQRCEQDGWSVAARACMAGAASQPEGQRCFADHLTNDQRKSLGEATQAALGNSKL